jgi:hypothetical protein
VPVVLSSESCCVLQRWCLVAGSHVAGYEGAVELAADRLLFEHPRHSG